MPEISGPVVLLTYLAVIASAISGALEARKHDMDVVGATTVAFVTAFGGGTIRDLLLGRTPIFWLQDPWLTVAAFVASLWAFYLIDNLSGNVLVIPDALGLGLFSILGASYAYQMHLSVLVSAMMGTVTGVFGGILRDVLCNQIPGVFRRNTELYATCSFVGALVFILLVNLNVDIGMSSLIGAATTFAIRMLAVRYRLTLPFP